MNRFPTSLIVLAVIIVLLAVVSLLLVDIVTVEGNQIGVMETWNAGVLNEPLSPKTYVLIPGFMKRIYTYDVSAQIFVMNDVSASQGEFGAGRSSDTYRVQSQEGQDMDINLNVRWSLDPSKIVTIHKTARDNLEEKILRPAIMRVVKDEATTRTAIEAYSGDGLVQLQQAIYEKLSSTDNELAKRGVIVENFVIEKIALDAEYVGEIKARQVAVQRERRAIEETKAALAEAERAKAEAQADYEKAVVEATRDKEVGVLEAQKSAEQEVLAAEAAAKKVELAAQADKIKVVLAAEGEQQAAVLQAQAITALGEAEAEATRLKLSAYSAQGAEAYVRIEVAKSMAQAFENIDGYLPSDMQINLLSESFLKGVGLVVDPTHTPSQ